MTPIEKLAAAIKKSRNLCVFTGAGISCPSGIPDFRSKSGLYSQKGIEGYSPEEIISHSFFVSRPELFYDFYRMKMIYPNARPNEAHLFFAELEKDRCVTVVTQNIDGLHHAAGSTNIYELHGSVHRYYCTICGRSYELDYILNAAGVPRCEADDGIIKPDVVLYEEPLCENTVSQAIKAISEADTLIVAGTSLTVFPAASYVQFFNGDTLAIINKTATGREYQADIAVIDDIIDVIHELRPFIWEG